MHLPYIVSAFAVDIHSSPKSPVESPFKTPSRPSCRLYACPRPAAPLKGEPEGSSCTCGMYRESESLPLGTSALSLASSQSSLTAREAGFVSHCVLEVLLLCT